MTDEMITDEQRELIDKMAKSISNLCHKVIARRLGQFFEVIAEEVQKPDIRGALSQAATSPAFEQLMKFYNVTSLEKLALAQADHVESLQKKLPPIRDEWPGYVPREG